MGRIRGSGNSKYTRMSVGEIEQREHVWMAETVLGKELPKGAIVHHVDGNTRNNASNNLVVCPNQSYHQLIHQRQRALEISGHADWRKCRFCKKYDSPENLRLSKGAGKGAHHLECDALYARKAREKKGTISFEKRRERMRLIRVKSNEGVNDADLASAFGLSLSSISRIKREAI